MKLLKYLLLKMLMVISIFLQAQEIPFKDLVPGCTKAELKKNGLDQLGTLTISGLDGDKKIQLHNEGNANEASWLTPEVADEKAVIDLNNKETQDDLGIQPDTKTFKIVISDQADKGNACTLTYSINSENGSSVATEQEYVQDKLYPKLGLTWHDYQIARKGHGDTTYIFLNSALKLIDKTEIPDCSRENAYYRIFVITKDDEYERADFEVRDGESSGFGILVGTEESAPISTTKTYPYKYFRSEVFGRFESSVKFKITLFKKDVDGSALFDKDNSFTIQGCNQPIHVTILGGFYYSTLNDPTKIASGLLPSGDTTLYADNTNSQRALTIMALFYPKARLRDYNHKNLSFMEKWGVAFGTKISQDLFSDLLLGLNYEFAKGGSFTTGVHYGKHTEIRGYDKFKFGETVYKGVFTNDKTTQQWAFGWFIGVTIDLRVITAIRGAAKRESDSNTTSRQP